MPAVGTDLLLIERSGVAYKATAAEIAALAGGGSSVLRGTTTVTVLNNRIEHVETVAAVGVTPSSIVMLSLHPGTDDDENDPEMLDLLAMSARPLTDQIEITASFGTPASGPVRFNWSAF